MAASSSTQRICIHQFHYSTAPGDAVTNQMLFIREALREAGVGGEIYAVENKAPESFGIRPFASSLLWNADLILVHHSHGNPALEDLLRVEIPMALIYHNITPARFFTHDPYIARLCELGRKQLREFRNRLAIAYAVSRYNARELRALGFDEVEIFPLFDLKSLLPAAREEKKKATKGPRELLFVGKLATHKNQALLVQMLYYLHRNDPGKYKLVLVGRQDPVYGDYLRLLVKALRLEGDVEFAGRVSEEELIAHYERAAAYVSTSRHEGFGIPLIEAMGRDLPVLALPATGIKETLGDAGVRFGTRLPHRLAEIVDTLLDHPAWVSAIVKGQQERLRELAQVHAKSRVPEMLLRVVHELRHPLETSATLAGEAVT